MNMTLAGASCVAALSLTIVAGCTVPAASPSEETLVNGSWRQQLRDGEQLYAANCASCHGADGKGTEGGPALVGETALPLEPPPRAKVRRVRFHTAEDVLMFAKKAIPANKPGSLSDSDYAAVVAFALKANGVDLEDRAVTPGSAAYFVIHPLTDSAAMHR